MVISVIGGAGIRTVNFINGLLEHRGRLHVDAVRLYDIDAEKLGVISKLCRYVVQRRGSDLSIEVCTDLSGLLSGSDVVVTTLRVGGDHSRVVDEEIAVRNGVIGQETTGAGGFFMACRTIPVLLDYMEAVRRYAPNALVFNFTNPSGLVTQALRNMGYGDEGSFTVLGICDAPSSVVSRIAAYFGVPADKVDARFAGLNHLSWIQELRVNGKDVLGFCMEDDSFLKSVQEFSIFDKNSFKLSGFLPNEYLYYYYHREKALSNILNSTNRRGRMIEDINSQMFRELSGMRFEADPENYLQTFLFHIWRRELSYMTEETGRAPVLPVKGNLEIPSGMGYAGVMLDCLEALEGDKPVNVTLNVSNDGSINCLRDDDIVEISCMVSNKGICPVKAKPFNDHCANLLNMIKIYERTAAQAILTQSRAKAIEALALHPLVMSYSVAERLVDDCIAAYPDSIHLK